MKRILSAGISLKVFSILALLALVVLLVPMLKAAQYDVPSADDYSNGLPTFRAWAETGSLAEVFKAGWERVYSLYFDWQGTFSAIFLFTLNPMIFGERYYMIGPWLILGILLLGIFTLTFAVWSGLFGASKKESTIIASVWSVLCTQFLPRASQGIYWYTGAVYYTFFFGLTLAACALLLRFILRKENDRGIGKLTAAGLLLFFIGGGNLVSGLTMTVLLITMELLLMLLKKSDWKPLLIPVLCFAVSFGINVAAPGNGKRQGYFIQPGMFESVTGSFRESLYYFLEWFTLPVIALTVLLIPVLWHAASKTGRRFVFPGLVSLYSVCLSGVMFFPPIYAMGEGSLKSLGRITNIIFFGVLFLVIFNLFYWIGWLVQKGMLPECLFPCAGKGKYSLVYLAVVLLVFGFGMTRIKWFDTTSISAFSTYRSGMMGNYWHVYKLRLEILKDPEVKDAVLKRFPHRPYVLFYQELSENPKENSMIAEWYGKDSVIIQ